MKMKLPLEVKALGWAISVAPFSLGCALLQAEPINGASANIAVSPELAEQGHEFYEMSCAQCHGDDAHGNEGMDLHNLSISNARIAATIKKGVEGKMPSFAKIYNDRQIAALVSYLRSLR